MPGIFLGKRNTTVKRITKIVFLYGVFVLLRGWRKKDNKKYINLKAYI